MKCADCKFWKLEDTPPTDDNMGSCHRHAPSPLFEGPLILAEVIRDHGGPRVEPKSDVDKWWRRVTAWPATGENDFCGDFAGRPQRKGFV